ncbi:MAG: SpoIIE family protein phosphatase [Bernardetiaceae bacterium]|nr:SpoIIE family protein phosphatase [Bernardetiaceae bacterium]
MAWFAYLTARQTLEAEINTRLGRVSSFLMHGTDQFVYERLHDVTTLAHTPELVTASATTDLDQLAELTALLKIHKRHNPWYSSVSYFDTARVRRVDTEGLALGQTHLRKHYWLALDTQDVAMDVSFSESLKRPVMHFASVVRNPAGQRTGVVASRVGIERLHEVFKSEVILSNGGALHALDSLLTIELLGADGQVLYSNRNPQDVLQRKYRSLTLLNWQLSRQDLRQQQQGYFEVGDQLFFYTKQKGYLDYPGNGWILVISLPKAAALAPVESLRGQVLSILLGMAALAGLVAWLVGRYFAGPLLNLVEAVRQLASGQLELQRSQLGRSLTRGDEIGHLARNFVHMADALDQQMTAQTELNVALSLTNREIEARNLQIATQKEELETTLDDLDKKNKKITASINYALRIQTAFLPQKESLKAYLPSSFILYQPKDIVSGDFYWFRQIKRTSLVGGEVTVVVAADCTGHGVPGALMTVIAENLLKDVLYNERVLDPAQALLRLDELMKLALKREGYAEGINHDGMDIALCLIDHKAQQLEFAGAHQGLFINRQGQLHELKGERFSIGAATKKGPPTRLATQNFALQPGDWLYLFTDGYTDQFGGVDFDGLTSQTASKFGRQRLRAMLTDLAHQPTPEAQLHLLTDTLLAWRGQEHQTDDITAIGFEFTA